MNMKQHAVKAGIVLALMVAGQAPAFAATEDLGTLAPGSTKGVLFAHTPGTFTDEVKFSIGTPGTGSADYYNFLVSTSKGIRSNIVDAIFSLTGPTSYTSSLTSGASYALALATGDYTAIITGKATGVNGGSYSLDITAPTPEPATWGLMGMGLLMAGYMATRRKVTTKVSFSRPLSFA